MIIVIVISNIISVLKPVLIPRETVASQYFLELAGYVGLPVISWNADNAALEKVGLYNSFSSVEKRLTLFTFSELFSTPASSHHQTSGHGHYVTSSEVSIESVCLPG